MHVISMGSNTLIEAASGTHTVASGMALYGPILTTSGGATTTNASTLYIGQGMTGATNNYALWVDAGNARFDGSIQILNHINATDNQLTLNIDSDTGQTGEVFRVFKDGVDGAGTKLLDLDASGNLVATADVTAYSDIALKENVVTIDSALEKVSKMRGVTYDRVDIDQSHAGIVAQELEAIAPELVHTPDNDYKSVAYGNLTAYLVEAIKELRKESMELKEEIEELKSGDR